MRMFWETALRGNGKGDGGTIEVKEEKRGMDDVVVVGRVWMVREGGPIL